MLPGTLKSFTLSIELPKVGPLLDRSTELAWFNHHELMQSVQVERDMKQFETQRKFLELKQKENVAQMAKQLATVTLPTTQTALTGAENTE